MTTRALAIDGTIEPDQKPATSPPVVNAARAVRSGIEITAFGDHARVFLDPTTGERWTVAHQAPEGGS